MSLQLRSSYLCIPKGIAIFHRALMKGFHSIPPPSSSASFSSPFIHSLSSSFHCHSHYQSHYHSFARSSVSINRISTIVRPSSSRLSPSSFSFPLLLKSRELSTIPLPPPSITTPLPSTPSSSPSISSSSSSPPPPSVSSSPPPPTSSSSPPSSPSSPPSMPTESLPIVGLFWFDNVYPMRIHWLDPRPLFVRHNHETVIPELMPEGVTIHEFIPRPNEGGVFVRFETKKGSIFRTVEEIEEAIIKYLKDNPRHAFLTPVPIHCHLVKGLPWMEDLLNNFPSSLLKFELRGPANALTEITREVLYDELRNYGQMTSLILNAYEKDKPRTGSVQFRRMFYAVSARACLHRGKIPVDSYGNIQLFLAYESLLKTSVIADFFTKHPRIAMPLVGVLLAFFTILIFDPLRVFNIINHITGRYSLHELSDMAWLNYLRFQFDSFLKKFRHSSLFTMFGIGRGQGSEASMMPTWSAREQDEREVRAWLFSSPERVLFLTGPMGSGKEDFVAKVTKGRKNVVNLDVSAYVDASDDDLIRGLSKQLGFRPGFTLLTWINNFMDFFTPGASKATNSSNNYPTQLAKIFECTSKALAKIHVILEEQNEKQSKSMTQASLKHVHAAVQAKHNGHEDIITDDDEKQQTLENKTEEKKEEKKIDDSSLSFAQTLLQRTGLTTTDKSINEEKSTPTSPPSPTSSSSTESSNYSMSAPGDNLSDDEYDNVPLFIIRGFNLENKGKHNNLFESIVRFAQSMTSAKLARFVVVSDSALHESVKAIPEIKLAQIELSDASVESAIDFVRESIKKIRERALMAQKNPSSSSSSSSSDNKKNNNLSLKETLLTRTQDNHNNNNNNSNNSQKTTVVINDNIASEQKINVDDKNGEQSSGIEDLLSLTEASEAEETRMAVSIIGGRYEDLRSLVLGLESGGSPMTVVQRLVHEQSNNIRSCLNFDDKNTKFPRVQLWQVIVKLVAAHDKHFADQTKKAKSSKALLQHTAEISYQDIVSNIFSGDESQLRSLIRSGYLRLDSDNGSGDYRLSAGSGVHLEAYRRLVAHKAFRASMDLLVAKYQIEKERTIVTGLNNEMMALANATQVYNYLHQHHHIKQKSSPSILSGVTTLFSSSNNNNNDVPAGLSDFLLLSQLKQESVNKLSIYYKQKADCEKLLKTFTLAEVKNNPHKKM